MTDFCRHGHPYDEQNTRIYRGQRNCIACGREASLRSYHRKKNGLPMREFRIGCDVPGCEEKHHIGGLCYKHYKRQKRSGRLDVLPLCAFPECTTQARKEQYCAVHLERVERFGSLEDAIAAPYHAWAKTYKASEVQCSVDGCPDIARNPTGDLQMCQKHERRMNRHGDPMLVVVAVKGEGRKLVRAKD